MAAQFAFIAKLDETDYCKPWLSVKPPMGVISPGRLVVIIYFALFLSKISANGKQSLLSTRYERAGKIHASA